MFTPELVTEILAIGAVALAVTQAIKKWLKWDGWKALIVSAVICVLLSLWKTLSVQPADWAKFIVLLLGVFLESNGIYHFGSYAIGKSNQKDG